MISPQDIIGQRVTGILVSKPDRPISMSDQSYSRGYVKLENGVVLDLDAPDGPCAIDETSLPLSRDLEHEKTFQPALSQTISDLLYANEYCSLCVVLESDQAIASVPGLFWIAPFLLERNEFQPTNITRPWQK